MLDHKEPDSLNVQAGTDQNGVPKSTHGYFSQGGEIDANGLLSSSQVEATPKKVKLEDIVELEEVEEEEQSGLQKQEGVAVANVMENDLLTAANKIYNKLFVEFEEGLEVEEENL